MKLSALEIRHATTLGQAVIPASAFGGLAATTEWDSSITRHVALAAPASILALRLALLVAWVAPFFMGYFRLFGGLSEATRVECLERLFKSPNYVVRQLMVLLKINVCLAVMSNDRVLQQIKAYEYSRPVRLAALGSVRTPT